MASGETSIQLCGRFAATVHGRRIEGKLPGRQGRLLFAYLAVHRRRPVGRAELIEALWPERAPAAADAALSALLSKLRRHVAIEGTRLLLADDAFVDLEAADEAIHRAESAVRRGAWPEAWGPARIALHTATRGFLPGADAPWIENVRRHLEDVLVRAHECVAEAGLGLGGPELDSAFRSSRALVELAPYRESGHRLLMGAFAACGNTAEALAVYERLRLRLREELGAAPSAATQALHRQLLG